MAEPIKTSERTSRWMVDCDHLETYIDNLKVNASNGFMSAGKHALTALKTSDGEMKEKSTRMALVEEAISITNDQIAETLKSIVNRRKEFKL